jgi:hypothetical protein
MRSSMKMVRNPENPLAPKTVADILVGHEEQHQ